MTCEMTFFVSFDIQTLKNSIKLMCLKLLPLRVITHAGCTDTPAWGRAFGCVASLCLSVL